MQKRLKELFLTGLLTAVAAVAFFLDGAAVAQSQTPVVRTPAETVAFRHAQFRRVGDAFKAVNDGLRASEPDLTAIRAAAASLAQLSGQVPTWFPAGSGAESGAETRAKPEIWSDRAGFEAQARNFRAAAQDLATVSAGTDIDAIRASARVIGQRCGSCHTAYRERE